MSRMLAVIAVIALSLSAVFLALAYEIGGENVFHDPQALRDIKPLIDLATRKEWRWTGGDTLSLDAPVNLRYQPQGVPNVTVTGPAGMVEHLQFADGRIATDTTMPKRPGEKAQAVISGVPIRKFVVNGGETLDLGHVDQDSLDIHVNGDGSVRGDGTVGRLSLVLSGSGDADLGALAVDAAKIAILGSGMATIAPRQSVEVFIAGSGHLALTTRPKSIKQTIVGSGEIEQLPGPPPPAPPKGPTPVPGAPEPPESLPTPRLKVAVGDTVTITGRENVDLGRIDQDELTVNVVSQATVTATGRVKRLKVSLAGSGEARLGGLQTGDADISIAGSGDVTIAPTGNVKVRIMGSGDVRLLTRPDSVERQIVGSGRVIEP